MLVSTNPRRDGALDMGVFVQNLAHHSFIPRQSQSVLLIFAKVVISACLIYTNLQSLIPKNIYLFCGSWLNGRKMNGVWQTKYQGHVAVSS